MQGMYKKTRHLHENSELPYFEGHIQMIQCYKYIFKSGSLRKDLIEGSEVRKIESGENSKVLRLVNRWQPIHEDYYVT